MGDLLAGYAPVAAFDELFAAPESPRRHALALHDALQTLSPADFADRCAARDRAFRDQGITFQLSGEERPFPLDLVPRIIPPEEWSVIERGVRQRVLALEAFLGDVYGAQRILADGVIPRRLVITSKHFHRQVAGIVPEHGVRIHVAGVDLVRDGAGDFRVLEDNLRVPSGISYVVENRRAMTRVFPELFASHRVRRVDSYPIRLLEALRKTAPEGVADPCVVVLTPGVHNSAYFEHSFLARQMGVELVEGSDLVVQDDTLYMRTTAGLQRIDVVYRRIDDDFLDPLLFRPDSLVGCAGLLHAARAGRVTLANAPGNGVADDKAVYPYVPEMIRYYLGEEPILANVDTYRLGDPDVCSWVLERLDQMVVKPVDGAGGYGIVIGPQADDETLAELTRAVRSDPRGYVAQDPIALSTAPTFVGGAMAPRHLDLRPFAVHDGDDVWVVPGGLTRVALRQGSLVVNSSQGGGSKDTWVLAGAMEAPEPPTEEDAELDPAAPVVMTPGAPSAPSAPARPRRRARGVAVRTSERQDGRAVLSRIAESLYWIGRSTERAEDTARLLDVHYHHLLEDRFADETVICAALLRAMGTDVPDIRDADAVMRQLAFAPSNPGSIVASLEVAWENARGAREAISSEMWEVLNTAHFTLANRAATAIPHEFFRQVRDRMSVLAGLADATLARDEGWRFLVLGRNVERIDMSARILIARVGSGPAAGWVTTLRCASAYEAYLRTYRHAVDASSAAEFLLLDHLFPRSVMHALATCERVLEELAPGGGRARVDDEARRRAGIARAELEFLRVDDLVADLPAQLAEVQRAVVAIHDAIAARYFLAQRVVEWSA